MLSWRQPSQKEVWRRKIQKSNPQFRTVESPQMYPEQQALLAMVENMSSHSTSDNPGDKNPPVSRSRLQTFSDDVLLQLLRHRDRESLRKLYNGPSRKVRTAAHLVMLEKLAVGIVEFEGKGDVDREQVHRKILLNGSIWNAEVDGSAEKLLRVPSIQGGGGGRGEESLGTQVHRSHVSKPRMMLGRTGLPDEILFQILEEQDDGLLRGLVLPRSNQLGLVAETILFKRYRALFKSLVSREWAGESKFFYGILCNGHGLRSPWSETPQQCLDREFVLVKRRGSHGGRRSFWSEEDDTGELMLGSFWKVICRAADF